MFQDYVEKKRSGQDQIYMRQAIEAAEVSKLQGEQARGAVLVLPNRIMRESQTVYSESDPTCHAEMNVIRQASQAHHRSLRESVLYVTTEPCAMCAAAIIHAGIQEVVFGAYDHVNGFATAKRLNVEGIDLHWKGGCLAEDCFRIAAPSLRESLRHE